MNSLYLSCRFQLSFLRILSIDIPTKLRQKQKPMRRPSNRGLPKSSVALAESSADTPSRKRSFVDRTGPSTDRQHSFRSRSPPLNDPRSCGCVEQKHISIPTAETSRHEFNRQALSPPDCPDTIPPVMPIKDISLLRRTFSSSFHTSYP